MEEEYDTDAFIIFVISAISIYLIIALIFIYRRIKRFISKEPPVMNNFKDSLCRKQKNPTRMLKWKKQS